MKPVVTRLYVLLVVLTLVGLAAWAAADWYQLRQGALAQGQVALRSAAGRVTDLTLVSPTPEASVLATAFASQAANPRWKVLVLSSPERGTEYYRGPRPGVPVESAVPHWAPRAFSEVALGLSVFRTAGQPLSLEGIYEFYGRNEIFSLLKACGITLLVLLVLTTGMVFLSSTPKRAPEPNEVPDEAPTPPDAEATASAAPEEDWTNEVATEEFSQPEVPASDDEYWFDDELTLEDLPPLEAREPEAVQPEESEEPTEGPRTAEAPTLFSPTSGLGWAAFLDTRLDQELGRAAAQNQDLALILFAFDAQPDLGLWGRSLRQSFPFLDLNFEYDQGAAVVLPGQTLEQALKSARTFVDTVGTQGMKVHAGVAARSGRLLSASTLLAEAASARRRTLAGTVKVLGLKTDPDRWREHLAAGEAS